MSEVNYFITEPFHITCYLYNSREKTFSIIYFFFSKSRDFVLTNNKGGKLPKLSASIGLTYGIARPSLKAYKFILASSLTKESCQIFGPRSSFLIFAMIATAFL